MRRVKRAIVVAVLVVVLAASPVAGAAVITPRRPAVSCEIQMRGYVRRWARGVTCQTAREVMRAIDVQPQRTHHPGAFVHRVFWGALGAEASNDRHTLLAFLSSEGQRVWALTRLPVG